MMRSKILQCLVVAASLAAAYVCYTLLQRHLTGVKGPAWFEAGCAERADGGSDCAAVLQSPWSYWPPKREGDPEHQARLPAAFLGMVYYSLLAVWFMGIGRPGYARRWWHVFPLILIALGMGMSVRFTIIMFTQMNEWCPWCLVTHGLNAMIAICALLLWPRRSRAESENERGRAAHPSGRMVLMTVVALWLVMFGQNQLLGKMNHAAEAAAYGGALKKYQAALERFRSSGMALMQVWQASPRREIALRVDDPARTAAAEVTVPLDVVVFSDFECPKCARVAAFLEGDVAKLFAGNLRVVFKHYPLHKSCNPETTTEMHPWACAAAQWAEGARLLGGTETFWRAHDFLFANQGRLKRGALSDNDVAQACGVEAAALREAAALEGIMRRIHEDARAGRLSELKGTPAVYVLGRAVDELGVLEIKFWDAVADLYWQSRQEPRPEETKLVNLRAAPAAAP